MSDIQCDAASHHDRLIVGLRRSRRGAISEQRRSALIFLYEMVLMAIFLPLSIQYGVGMTVSVSIFLGIAIVGALVAAAMANWIENDIIDTQRVIDSGAVT